MFNSAIQSPGPNYRANSKREITRSDEALTSQSARAIFALQSRLECGSDLRLDLNSKETGGATFAGFGRQEFLLYTRPPFEDFAADLGLGDPASRRYTVGQPHIATDNRTGTDDNAP
jgi:hypothetical protein